MRVPNNDKQWLCHIITQLMETHNYSIDTIKKCLIVLGFLMITL